MFAARNPGRRSPRRSVIVGGGGGTEVLDASASRYYFDSDPTPFIDGYRKMVPTPSGVRADLNVSSTASGTDIFVYAFTTGRVRASGWTLSGSVAFACQAFESVLTANAKLRAKLYKRVAAGTETLIGTLDSASELTASAASVTWSGTPTTTTFAEDDRLVVKLFLTNVGTMANGFVLVNLGSIEGGGFASWMTLPSAVQFKTDVAVPLAIPTTGITTLNVGDNLNTAVQAAATGAKFLIKAGVHRLASIVPKANQQFYGEPGAILNGAKVLTGWVVSGSTWYVTGQTQQGLNRAIDECLVAFPNCNLPDQVYIDNVPLKRVASTGAVVTGTFFFDYTADRIYIGDNPSGQVVEAAATPFAIASNATGVLVQGLIVEKYATPTQYAAIGYDIDCPAWTVQFCEARLNYSVGINVGPGGSILYCYMHHNMEMGCGIGPGTGCLIKGNEIAYNGVPLTPYFNGLDPLWEGGGGKFAVTDGLQVRNNYVHHNGAFGLWTDIDNINTLYENNRVEHNHNGGISHEISYDAIIRNNTFVGNGFGFPGDGTNNPSWLWGPAIQIQNSRNVDCYGNTIDGTGGYSGITIVQQDRGMGAFGETLVISNSIHNNTVKVSDEGAVAIGLGGDYDEPGQLTQGNTQNYNYYLAPDITNEHWWYPDANAMYGFAAFKTASGQDANSIAVNY